MSLPYRAILRLLTIVLLGSGLSLVAAGSAPAAPAAEPDPVHPGGINGVIDSGDAESATGRLTLYRWNAGAGAFETADSEEVDVAMPAPYAFPNLAPGDYYLAWTDDSGQYHDAFSRGATSAPTTPADPGTVTVSDGTVAVDIALETIIWRQVTGTVTGPNDVPLDAASIDAYELMAGGGLGDRVDRILTAPDGSFELALPDGDFVLLVSGHDPDTGDEYATARVEVTVAGDTTVPVVRLSPPAWYQVSGRVLLPTDDAAGDPAVGFEVELVHVEGAFEETVGRATTDSSGEYSFTARPGTYRVEVPQTEDYEGTSVAVTVEAEDLAAPDLTLAPAGVWVVTGSVMDAAGQPLGDAQVNLYRVWGEPGDWWDQELVATVTSESDGSYELTGVPANRTYTVRAAAFGHAPRFLGQVTNLGDSDTFELTGDTVLDPIALDEASTVSGTVDGPDGPAAEVQVELYRWHDYGDGDGAFEWTEETSTDLNGAYAFGTVPPGNYTLRFDGRTSTPPLEARWLAGTAVPTGTGDPGTFEVTDEVADLVHDAILKRTSGRITDQYGLPVQGATVTLRGSDLAEVTFTTDDAGVFHWDVQAGSYEVQVEHQGWGCDTVTTAAMEAPPERTDLLIKLTCGRPAPAPESGPALSGTPKVGQTLTVVPAAWPDPIDTGSTTLLRNQVPVTLGAGGTYVVQPADAGARFTVHSQGRRADHVQEGGTGQTVTFEEVDATSGDVTIGALASTTKVTASAKKIRAGGKVKLTIVVGGAGVVRPTGKVTVFDGAKRLKTVTLTAAMRGKVVVTVVLRKKGKHRIAAAYAGSSTVAPSRSKVVVVTAK